MLIHTLRADIEQGGQSRISQSLADLQTCTRMARLLPIATVLVDPSRSTGLPPVVRRPYYLALSIPKSRR